MGSDLFNRALLGLGPQDRYTARHAIDKGRSDRLVDRDNVLFLVIVAGAQHLVDQIAIVGQKDQSLGLFVQTANRENTDAVIDKVHDVLGLFLGGAFNAHRLVQRNQNKVFFFHGIDQLAIYTDLIAWFDRITDLGALAVDVHIALFDKAVGLTTRANTAFTDEFIEPFGGCREHEQNYLTYL